MDYLKPLPWDTDHFGIRVARISCSELDDSTLTEILAVARRQGIRLVYWAVDPGRSLPAALVQEYEGKLVDRKATFQRDLTANDQSNSVTAPMRVFTYPKGPPSTPLLALAVAAGEYSRFRLDHRIPYEKFETLYEAWMKGSTLGRLADAVLVASIETDSLAPAGMITVAGQGAVGVIGLVAVHEAARGHGVGSLLIWEAHRWMKLQGLTSSTVVTQLANRPACKLYERCGYHLQAIENVYHFWPSAQ